MEDELDLTQEQIDNMTQEEWDNLPIVTGPNPSRSTPGTDGTINLSNEELENPSKQAGPSPKLSAYKTPTVWEMKNYHGGIKPLNVKQSYEFDYDKHEDDAPLSPAALPQNEGDLPWGNISQGRGFLSNLASDIKGKLKDPSFQKDVKNVAGIASFVIPWGRVLKAGGKLFKAFSNTPKQLARGYKAKPKFPKMSARDKKFFNADGSSKTGDLYASARARFASKVKSPSSSTFKPLVTGNKVWDTKSINKAFESRFGKPQVSSLEKAGQNILKNSPEYKKLQQRLDATQIVPPKGGYFRTMPDGGPVPSNLGSINAARLRAEKLKAAREITGK